LRAGGCASAGSQRENLIGIVPGQQS